jgi:ribosomal protein L4
LKNSLIISDKSSTTKICKSARNIPNVKIIDEQGANAYDILKFKNIIFTTSSIKTFQDRLTK